ncbi:MAG TPA: hypothetical protein VLX09_16305 [Stellaceae bacterium]|nr:hypothetical protein [Stellaceae bacterium]
MDHLAESDRLRRDLKHYRAELGAIMDPRDARILSGHISEIETRLRALEDKHRLRLWALSESDVWRAALRLVNRHGIGAPEVAGQRADALSMENHFEGVAAWRRIRRATVELQRIRPKSGERIH